ncbi:MAG: methyltransferase domain-containing protein, partial [Candidatus Zixiibacteriota bacterium]
DQRISENNYLHQQIKAIASELIGLDINAAGIAKLIEFGFEAYAANIEKDFDLLNELAERVDIIVVPEVVEHLNNVGLFLDNLRRTKFTGEILISVPNSFSYRSINALNQNIELVHPDHNYYFSYTTLTGLLKKYDFKIEKYAMYYWPSNDELGRRFEQVVRKYPYSAEGIIVVIRNGVSV